jgi:hypothetical protein
MYILPVTKHSHRFTYFYELLIIKIKILERQD